MHPERFTLCCKPQHIEFLFEHRSFDRCNRAIVFLIGMGVVQRIVVRTTYYKFVYPLTVKAVALVLQPISTVEKGVDEVMSSVPTGLTLLTGSNFTAGYLYEDKRYDVS